MSGPAPLVAIASAVSWFHPLFQRPHHLAVGLARRGFEVVFASLGSEPHPRRGPIEVAGTTVELFALGDADLPAFDRRLLDLAGRAIYKLSALTGPLGIRRFFDEGFAPERRAATLVPRLAARMLAGERRPRALLIGFPAPGIDRLAERLRREGVVIGYDMLDDFTALGGYRRRAAVERRLLEVADFVLVTAAPLEAAARRRNRNVLRVPNAVEPESFRPARGALPPPPGWPYGEGACGPVIGYAGAVWDWFDVDLVRAAALARPGWRFLLVGMARPEVAARLGGLANVALVGPRPFAELPQWFSRFDVATIPFRIGAVSASTNPVKVYEYLAAGRPVVSSDLPEVRGIPGVAIAAGLDAWLAACERALAHPLDLAAIDRFLAGNTWERRIDAVAAAIAGTARS